MNLPASGLPEGGFDSLLPDQFNTEPPAVRRAPIRAESTCGCAASGTGDGSRFESGSALQGVEPLMNLSFLIFCLAAGKTATPPGGSREGIPNSKGCKEMSGKAFRFTHTKIKCCDGCLPPKRNPYCHSTCPEYKQEREKADADRAAEKMEKDVKSRLNSQTYERVEKALKAQRK